MKAVGDVFYSVSMSGPRQVEDVPASHIPRCVKLLTTFSKYIPESRSIETSAIDVKDFHLNIRLSKMNILLKRIKLSNKLFPLDREILLKLSFPSILGLFFFLSFLVPI